MDSIIKLNSIFSGDYNSSNNRIDFDIYDGTYDFQQSYVNIRADLITPEVGSTAAGYKGVHLVQIGKGSPVDNDAQYQLHPIALVKNCYLNSSTQGNIDDIREVRLLQNTLKTYTESTSEQLSSTYDSTYQRTLASRTKHSVFRELYRSGDVMSRNVSSNIRIPLSDLSGVGSMSSYTVSPNEKLRLHLEIDKSGLQFYSTDDWQMYGPSGNMDYFELDNYTNTSGGPETEATFESINNFINEKDIPLWTGQLVDVTANSDSPDYAIVKSIKMNSNTHLSITLTQFETPIPSGTSLTGIYIERVPCDLDPVTGVNLRLYDAEIVLHKKANTVKAQPTEFRTYTTEQFNANGQTDFRRMFQVEPNCVNLMVMFPRDNAFSFNNNVQNYRIALNNIYLSDREISFRNGQWDSLYLDELQRLFMNANLPLNCLSQIEPFFNGNGAGQQSKLISYFGSNTYSGTDDEPFKHKILGTPLPLTAGEKNVELDIQSTGTGIGDMVLFKQVTRLVSA
jgi:hypothetical protein